MRGIIGSAAVVLAMTAALATGCGPDENETGSLPDLLTPGAEFDGMRLTTANAADTPMWEFCDPLVDQPGTHAAECEVPELQRLMVGYGWVAETPEDLEQTWQRVRWQLSLDGRPVDLPSFGTLPDIYYFEPKFGHEMWLRLWAITIVNPTPGPHTLHYTSEALDPADVEVERSDQTWTLTVA